MAKRCLECGKIVANRSKSTKHCRECHLKLLSLNKSGRNLPNCNVCGKKLSTVKNKTGKCRECCAKDRIPWNKGKTGFVPWNKGVSRFKSKEEYKDHARKLRAARRRLEPPENKIADRLRTLIRNQLKKQSPPKSGTKTERLLGCSVAHLKRHLESQFKDGMTWKNYGNGHGKWNMDHIRPISSFDLSLESEQEKAFNYKNCQPLWAIDNIKKGNKLTTCVTF